MLARRCIRSLFLLLLLKLSASILHGTTAEVQARIDRLHEAGEPVVVHVVVALCDNLNQGIVPVPDSLGNGQDPKSNLYWGALYGVRTHLRRSGFELARHTSNAPNGVLERIVLTKTVARYRKPLQVVVVADAWDGSRISTAIQQFLSFAAGRNPLAVHVSTESQESVVQAGGAATVLAFVGHNGLMDFNLSSTPKAERSAPARASIVLACASKPYFLDVLRQGGSHPLLLTTGLMAPEAYTLVAAVTALAEGGTSADIRESAAQAYNTYQKCGIRGARDLFHVE